MDHIINFIFSKKVICLIAKDEL